jgi:hypothetical protein
MASWQRENAPMNFMQWLNSLDELLFEILSWVIFFPITLWRIIRHPLSMMAYAEAQLALPEDDQYGDALSPPIFLVLSLLLAQALELTLVGTNAIVRSRHGLASLAASMAARMSARTQEEIWVA